MILILNYDKGCQIISNLFKNLYVFQGRLRRQLRATTNAAFTAAGRPAGIEVREHQADDERLHGVVTNAEEEDCTSQPEDAQFGDI